jgi:hypothetical protein
MCVVVGSAITLMMEQIADDDGQFVLGVVFAFLSGPCLILRVVAQKMFRFDGEGKSGFAHVLDEYIVMVIGAFIVLSAAFALQFLTSTSAFANLREVTDLFTIPLVLFHPIYQLFSLITLTFVATITHSLLNLSKRVLALVVAIYWFNESMTWRVILGCVGTILGGYWYTIEKYAASSPDGSGMKIALFKRRAKDVAAPLTV